MNHFVLKLALIFGLLMTQQISFAQTNVSGTLTENTTWTVDKSPYVLVGDVGVPNGITLTIDPGVTVSSDASGNSGLFGSYVISIKGNIKAIGGVLNNITFQDTDVSFQETNLTSSNFEKVTFNNFGSLLSRGNKNTGTLNILNSTFESNSYVGTMGYDTPSKIVFKNCKLTNSNIGKHFGGNDAIEIWDSEITETNISMSWSSDSISLFNSEIKNSSFTAEIDGFFHVDSCSIIESKFFGEISEVSILNSQVENSSFFLYDHLKISNSEVFLTYEDPVKFSRDHHIRAKSVELIETQFDGNNLGKNGVLIFGSKKSVIKKCDFNNYRKAILFEGTSLEVNTNNFSDIDEYVIENLTPNNINAKENYWGTFNEDSIGLKIYDRLDNGSKGLVDFSNYLKYSTFRDVISAPKNVLKGDLGQKTTIIWDENKESTLEGYKIYKKNIISNDFVLIADVGNINSFEEILDIEEEVYIMAYAIDTAMETKGQIIESKFSEPAKEFFEVDYISSTSLCKGAQILASISENYEFDPDNFYTLQLSSVADSFANPVVLDTIREDQDTLTSFLPDTLQFGEPYLVRVISSDLGILSQPEELIFYDLPSAEFNLVEEACQADTITISYSGQTSDDLTFDWDLGETILVENQGDTLIKIIGGAYGEKPITLTTSKNGCTSTITKSINNKKTPSATFDIESDICEGETAIVTYTGNGADSAQYIWDFGDATVISGEKSGPYELKWDSFGLKRIGLKVTENGCSFGESAVIINYSQIPQLSFEGLSTVCYNENYEITYTGTHDGDITWDFKNATVVSGSGAGPYLLKWDSSGEKTIGFSIDNHNCISDTTLKIFVTPEPVIPEICLVTVDDETSNNMLVWSYDLETVNKFGIYRETNTANEYNLIEYIDGGQFNTFIDEQSDPDQNSNRYKITAIDSCGTETDLSDFHKTIHLTINKGLEDSWNLIWDGYEGFTFGTYKIYRSINNEEFVLVKELASNLTSYTDKNVVANSVAYQIEVVNPDGCGEVSNGRILQYTSSKSNVAKIGAVTGIEKNLLNNIISISPNPTSNYLQIDFNKRLTGNYSITNLDGKEVMKGEFESNFKVDLREYKSGIYFLNIITPDGSVVKKILKD